MRVGKVHTGDLKVVPAPLRFNVCGGMNRLTNSNLNLRIGFEFETEDHLRILPSPQIKLIWRNGEEEKRTHQKPDEMGTQGEALSQSCDASSEARTEIGEGSQSIRQED